MMSKRSGRKFPRLPPRNTTASRSKLLSTSGSDHVGRPIGGGIDIQATRARLTWTGSWDITAAQGQVWNRQPSLATEWSTYASIYDQYKVNGMKITWHVPKYVLPVTAAADGVATWPDALHVCYDNDSIALPAGGAPSVIGYSNYQCLPFDGVVSYACKTLPEGANYGDTTGYINSAKWCDVNHPDALAGTIMVYQNKAAVTTVAPWLITFVVEYDVTFKGKRN